MNKKLFLIFSIFALPFLLQVLNSCNGHCDNECHMIIGVDLKLADNSDSTEHPIINNSVKAKALMLSIDFKDSVRAGFCRNNIDFMPAAYAMMKKDCGSAYMYIDSLSISSNKDFDASHPAHSDLADLFYEDAKNSFGAIGSKKFLLTHQPLDTGTHIFTACIVIRGSGYPTKADTFIVSSVPVKLLK